MIPISLKELQVKISFTRPVKAVTVAASLYRLYRKGRVIRTLVGTHYVYSLMSKEQSGALEQLLESPQPNQGRGVYFRRTRCTVRFGKRLF